MVEPQFSCEWQHAEIEKILISQPRQHIKKKRHIFSNKICIVKPMIFPVVMYGCESWTMKKAEHRKIDAFKLWCWRRFSRVSWTPRRSNQSILKEISLQYSLEVWCWNWSSNTLATRCEELIHWKRPWCWGRLKAEGEGDGRGWDGWMASPTQRTSVWSSFGNWWRTRKPGVLLSMGSQRVIRNWATELNWTENNFVVSDNMLRLKKSWYPRLLWRNVWTWTNTLVNEMQVEGAGGSFWKWLTWPACSHLPRHSSWKVYKVDGFLAVSAKYINKSDNLRTRNS